MRTIDERGKVMKMLGTAPNSVNAKLGMIAGNDKSREFWNCVNFVCYYGYKLKPSRLGDIHVERLFGSRKFDTDDGLRVLYYGPNFPGADHASLWIEDGEAKVFVSQPYDKPAKEDIAKFKEKHPNALVEIWPRFYSWWYPGKTWLIVVTRLEDIRLKCPVPRHVGRGRYYV